MVPEGVHDLRGVEIDLEAEPPLLDDALFHCQQAVEKVLKGFLVWHDQPFRKTHSIEEVGEQCIAFDPALRPLVDRAAPLTEYAWKYRYPGEAEDPSRSETEAALQLAREVFDEILTRLPEAVRPERKER